MQTKNEALQLALQGWAEAISAAFSLPNPSAQRTDAIIDFCRTFVPHDVTEDDIMHFSGNLSMDDVRQIYVQFLFMNSWLIDLLTLTGIFRELCA